MKIIEKRKLLVELIEMKVKLGHDILDLVGRAQSYFNYEVIQEEIKELKSKIL